MFDEINMRRCKKQTEKYKGCEENEICNKCETEFMTKYY